MFQKILKALTYIPGLISGIETVFGRGNGKQKQEQVIDASLLMLDFERQVRDKGIVDEKMFREGLTEVNDGVHKMLKASGVIQN